MIKIALNTFALILIAGMPSLAPAQRTQAEIVAEIERETRAFAEELERVNGYLVYYDQLQRLGVVNGTVMPAEAEARTRAKGNDLYINSFEEPELYQLVFDHSEAATAYFSRVEREALNPGVQGGSNGREAVSAARLKAARALYERLANARQDPLAALESAAEVHAWANGYAELTPAVNPFAGQAERIRSAIPDERAQAIMSASEMTPPDVAKELPLSAPETPVDASFPGIGQPNINPAGHPIDLPNYPVELTPFPVPAPTVNASPAETLEHPGLPPSQTGGDSLIKMGVPNEPSADFMQRYGEASGLYQAGRYAEALPLYDELVRADSSFRQALFERGVMRLWLNQPQGSLDDFRILAKDPNDLESRRLRICLELCIGDVNAAKAEGDKLLALQPNNPQIVLAAGQAALWAGEQARGQQLLQSAISMDPNVLQGLYQQASTFLQAGVPSVAAVQFVTVAWMDSNQAGAYYGLGMAEAALGRKKEAREAFERYLQMDSTSYYADSARQYLQSLR